ncbi:MAG: polyprenyl synthetase family protein [Candidatus Margulisiibacteriota bacterium]
MIKLARLKDRIKDDLKEINKIIDETLTGSHDELQNIYNYLKNEKGKQVRSSIIILIGNLITTPNKKNLYHLAAGIELIHLASLIHDDIIDEADIRRNQETIYKKYGINNAIITGVHCYSLALNQFALINDPSVIKEISKCVTHLCEGEFIQVNERNNFELSENDYWRIVRNKTSALFHSACKLSAKLCKLSENDIDKLGEFGNALGDIFQLADDYLDFYDNKNHLSKKVEQDLMTGDISLPILMASLKAKNLNKSEIQKSLLENNQEISNQIKNKLFEKKNSAITSLDSISESLVTKDLKLLLEIITDRIN